MNFPNIQEATGFSLLYKSGARFWLDLWIPKEETENLPKSSRLWFIIYLTVEQWTSNCLEMVLQPFPHWCAEAITL